MSPARMVAVIRLVWSVVLLAAPKAVLSAALAPTERGSPRARGVVMVLGARNLIQALVELSRPTRVVLGTAAGVDAVHALSFLGLAAARPEARWRRAARLNVVTALMFCAATSTTALAADARSKRRAAAPPERARPAHAQFERSRPAHVQSEQTQSEQTQSEEPRQ